jgi:hypothetical protein
VHASTSREIDAAFAAFERDRPDALFVAAAVPESLLVAADEVIE